MADVRVQLPVKIVDPTTDANQAGVSAAGNLNVAVNLALPAGTNNIGDVDVLTLPALVAGTANIGDVDVLSVVPGTAATNLGKAEDDPHTTGDVGVMVLGIRDDTLSIFSGIENDYEPFHMTSTGRLYVSATVDAALPTGANNIGDVDVLTLPALVAGTANIGDVDVISQIPGTGATNLGKAEDAAHVTGDTGVFMLAVRQNTATALAGTDGDYIPLIVDTNGRLHVTDPNAGTGVPTVPVVTADSAAAIAAGTEDTTIQTADLGGTTKKLAGIDLTASVAFKARIAEVVNGVETNRSILFGQAGNTIQWRPPHKNYFNITFAANAGFDGWRAAMTNMDTSEAADLYATFYTED